MKNSNHEKEPKLKKLLAGLRKLKQEKILQNDIAKELNISPTEITHIKNGEKNNSHIFDMVAEFLENKLEINFEYDEKIDRYIHKKSKIVYTQLENLETTFDFEIIQKVLEKLTGTYNAYYFSNSKNILRCCILIIEVIDNKYLVTLTLPQLTYTATESDIYYFEKNNDLQIDFKQNTDVLHLTAHISLSEILNMPEILFSSISLLSAEGAPLYGLLIIIRTDTDDINANLKNINRKELSLNQEQLLIWDFFEKFPNYKTNSFRNIHITNLRDFRDLVKSHQTVYENKIENSVNHENDRVITIFKSYHETFLQVEKTIEKLYSDKPLNIKFFVPTMYFMWNSIENIIRNKKNLKIEIAIINFENEDITSFNKNFKQNAEKSFEMINNYTKINYETLKANNNSIDIFLYNHIPVNTGTLVNDEYLFSTYNAWSFDDNLRPGGDEFTCLLYHSGSETGKYYIKMFNNWFEYTKRNHLPNKKSS